MPRSRTQNDGVGLRPESVGKLHQESGWQGGRRVEHARMRDQRKRPRGTGDLALHSEGVSDGRELSFELGNLLK